MMKRRSKTLGVAVAAAVLAWTIGLANPLVTGTHWSLTTVAFAQEEATAAVEGFRSARFGMTEADVRKALMKDFDIAEDDIVSSNNSLEKTTSLVINIDEIIPDSGSAVAGYIFGYKSERLIQVNIIWGSENEATNNAMGLVDDLVATANILRRYFMKQGFPAESMITNTPLEGGSVLVFRGIDDQGRVAKLKLNISPGSVNAETGEEEQTVSLILNYIVNPSEPDIFKVEEGQF